MFIKNGTFTSESVSEGQADKLADRISDAILDECLKAEPVAGVNVSTLLTKRGAVISGEFVFNEEEHFKRITTQDGPHLIKKIIEDAGYGTPESGIDLDQFSVQFAGLRHSEDLVNAAFRSDKALGSGSQTSVFGYATAETPQLLPAPILYANQLMERYAKLRRSKEIEALGPDATTQVRVRYDNGKPVEVDRVVLSLQHQLLSKEEVVEKLINPVIPEELRAKALEVVYNPAGTFKSGGTQNHTGVTGRKQAVDTYGGQALHGGGAFSGKNPWRLDRSGAYMARFLAKQVVARGWAKRCLVQIDYSLGSVDPTGFRVQAEGASPERNSDIAAALRREFDLTPKGIIAQLDLLKAIYFPTAAYGHFGRSDLNLAWEHIKSDVPDTKLVEFNPIACPTSDQPEPSQELGPLGAPAPTPALFPYIVVRHMATVYGRQDIIIEKGELAWEHTSHRVYARHPEPFLDDGSLNPKLKHYLVENVLKTVEAHPHIRMCLVWSANSCTFCELGGVTQQSTQPPFGGISPELFEIRPVFAKKVESSVLNPQAGPLPKSLAVIPVDPPKPEAKA